MPFGSTGIIEASILLIHFTFAPTDTPDRPLRLFALHLFLLFLLFFTSAVRATAEPALPTSHTQHTSPTPHTPHAPHMGQVEQVAFWTMQLSPFHDAYIKGVIAAFEKKHPAIRIKWVDVPWAEMEKKTLSAVAAKMAPDVVNLNPQFASKLAEFGALADPEKFLSRDEVDAFLPGAWRANRLQGRTFALPWYLTTNVLLYNKQTFARAEVAVPTNHNELIQVARRIRERTGSYAYFPALDGSIPLESLVAMGGELFSADGCRAGFINVRGEEILAHYQTLYRDSLVPRNVVTEGHRKAVEMFLSGQVAMVTTGMQFLQFIKTSNPDFYQHVGVAPQIGFGRQPSNIAAMNVSVLESSKNKRAAFAFAQFLTNPENQAEFAKRVPILPSTTASYQAPFFSSKTDDTVLDRARAFSIEQVKSGAVLVPPMKHYGKFRASYARGLQSVMLGRAAVPDALRDIDRTWSALLGCRKSDG